MVLLPLATVGDEPDAGALARVSVADAAALLREAGAGELVFVEAPLPLEQAGEARRLVSPTERPDASELATWAERGAAVAGTVQVEDGFVAFELFACAAGGGEGEARGPVPLAEASVLADALAQLGADALGLTPADEGPGSADEDAVRRYVRGADALLALSAGAAGEPPDVALAQLLSALELDAAFVRPRDALVTAASRALDTEAMPLFFGALSELARLRPDDAIALCALGEYAAFHRDATRAARLFAQALERDPLAARPRLGLALLAEARGDVEAALALYADAERDARDDARLLARHGALLVASGAPAAAVQTLARAAVLDPTDADVRRLLARAYELRGDPDRARAELAALAADFD